MSDVLPPRRAEGLRLTIDTERSTLSLSSRSNDAIETIVEALRHIAEKMPHGPFTVSELLAKVIAVTHDAAPKNCDAEWRAIHVAAKSICEKRVVGDYDANEAARGRSND
ncbi:MAG TPA: hypothetical protein VGE52_20450 [Pirellulales bacterium]